MSHVDQLTFVFRFVNEKGKVVERFIRFKPIHILTGSSLTDSVMTKVRDLGLDLSNCRGQAYDDASNMSRKYNGLQVQLKKNNALILYITKITFFDLLQALNAFCSTSKN